MFRTDQFDLKVTYTIMNYVLLFSTWSLSVSKYRDYSVKDDVIVPYRGMMIRTQFYGSDYLLSRDLVIS